MARTLTLGAIVALLLLAPSAPLADTPSFDLSGKIYTKYMYQNDATQGCLSMSNPFWIDNIGGHNGACTEFELAIKARVSAKVSAGLRLQSRWGAIWQDWWENGDLKSGFYDTSGESLGMNHAAYMKLRGAWARVAPPIPTVRWVTIGATDFSNWNEWTIGKARYIDRDNGNAFLVEGELAKPLTYTVAALALPKLWAGPGWQTGIPGENGAGGDVRAKLYGTDWGWAAKLEGRVGDDVRVRAIGSWLQDWEPDRFSPMLTGDPSADRGADHSVALATRFRGLNATLDATWTPSALDVLSVSAMAAVSSNYVNPNYATNMVANGQGFSPVLFRVDSKGRPMASSGYAAKVLVESFDPFRMGLSAKLEYFNIGAEYNAVMGARREADVLLTDGLITGGFTRGGQLPTLNIANEFVDWDEPWYESCIGWHGATALLEYVGGSIKVTGELTFIGYNTNAQGRDVDNQFPDFLYTSGFTDTTAFTADSDYANIYDRGRDPRSVYADFQSRRTQLAVLAGQLLLPRGVVVAAKAKYVDDWDGRKADRYDDNYWGRSYLGLATVSLQPTNELKTTLGYEYTLWLEDARNGTQDSGYFDAETRRHTVRAGLTYAFGGALLSYTLEYFHKDLLRGPSAPYDLVWNVWRSKATFEVAW